jgi:ABC-type nitrate/sulfonate/bicarbonate transport system substrate-binding protein
MKRKLSVALLVASVVFWSHPGYSQEKIRIGVSAVSLGFLPTVVAEKKGFYSKYGLMPEHVLVPCAIATNDILSEDLDYNVCTGPGIAAAIKGLPIKLVMTTQDKLGIFCWSSPASRKSPTFAAKPSASALSAASYISPRRLSSVKPAWNPGKISIFCLAAITALD